MNDLPSLLLAATALTASACAADLQPEAEPDAGDPAPAGKVSTVRNPDGTYTTRVDATAMDGWTRVDVETGVEPSDEGAWDFAARRFHIKLNGGVSGSAGVEVAPVPGSLADVSAAPSAGWITDDADGDDADAEPDYAFAQGDGWYAYDPTTHALSPRPLVWVMRTGDQTMIKLVIEDYYDDAGTSGVFTLRWAPL